METKQTMEIDIDNSQDGTLEAKMFVAAFGRSLMATECFQYVRI